MRYLLTLLMLALSGSVYAVDPPSTVPAGVTEATTALLADGALSLAAIGGVMLTLAGLAILFKWAKAAFFS